MDISVAITWVLYLALFPMAFIWLRSAYTILVKKDYSKVALKQGEPPKQPEKYATASGLIALATGLVALWLVLGVPLFIAGINIGPFDQYRTWTSIAAVNLWMKIFADFFVRSFAHPFKFGKAKVEEEENGKG